MVLKSDSNEATPAQDRQVVTADADTSLTVDGCVCPQCFKPLKAPAVVDHGADRYGRHTRSYAGMCFQCRQACKVVQFERDGKWLIHKYRPHRYESGAFVAYGDWIVVNPLPAPPAILTGPGGRYDKALDITDDPVIQVFRNAFDVLSGTAKAFGELIQDLKKIRGDGIDNRKH